MLSLEEGDEQPAASVSYSVHEVKHFFPAVSLLFVKLIYHGAGTVVHLLLLKYLALYLV